MSVPIRRVTVISRAAVAYEEIAQLRSVLQTRTYGFVCYVNVKYMVKYDRFRCENKDFSRVKMFRYRFHLDQQLVTEIESRPILWNRSLHDYRKASLRETAWKDLARTLQISSSECKRRWRTLRDSFVKYHRSRHLEGGKSDPSRKRMWIFYDLMSFLIPHIDCRESTATVDNNRENIDEVDFDVSVLSKESKPELTDITFELGESSSHNPLELDDFSRDESDLPEHFPLNDNTPRGLDPDEQFLISYAPVLKRLSPQRNAQARLKIQKVLYEIEFGEDAEQI